MMYAVVLQNAAEEARLAEYERRMVQNNAAAAQAQEEEDPDDDDIQQDPGIAEEQGIEGDDLDEARSSGTERNEDGPEGQHNQNDQQSSAQDQSSE